MSENEDTKQQTNTAVITIGDFLKEVRAENNLTQREAAELMNVSLRTYIYYEMDEREITARSFLRFIFKFKVKGAVRKFIEKCDFFAYKDTSIKGFRCSVH